MYVLRVPEPTYVSALWIGDVQESPVANKIKEAFFSERGLAGNVHKLPFDKLFSIDSVKRVGRSWGVKAHKTFRCAARVRH